MSLKYVIIKNKRDTLQPKQGKDEEALELQARQGKMVAGKLQSRNQEASEEWESMTQIHREPSLVSYAASLLTFHFVTLLFSVEIVDYMISRSNVFV